jgi:hypothetical protein
MCFRLAGIYRFPGPLLAWLQETNSLRHSRWQYPGKTTCSSCRWHLNHSAQHAQSFSGRAQRPPGGFQGRLQDVVCQFVGFGLVPQYIMKADGVEATWRHIATRSATYMFYYNNYVHYIAYFNLNDLIDIIDILWINANNWSNINKKYNAYNILKMK